MNYNDPKVMALILTQEGFLKWAEGNPFSKSDMKPQWAYLFREMIASSLKEEPDA